MSCVLRLNLALTIYITTFLTQLCKFQISRWRNVAQAMRWQVNCAPWLKLKTMLLQMQYVTLRTFHFAEVTNVSFKKKSEDGDRFESKSKKKMFVCFSILLILLELYIWHQISMQTLFVICNRLRSESNV